MGALLTQQLPRLPLDCVHVGVGVHFHRCWLSNRVRLVRGLAGRCCLAQPFGSSSTIYIHSHVVANLFVNIFWLEYASLYTTYSYINFTWFVLLSHQKFDDKSLFKPGDLYNLLPFWINSKQNNFHYKTVLNNAEFTFIKKSILIFFKKFTLFTEWSLHI